MTLNPHLEKFQVLDHSPVGMFVIEADYKVLFWNRCLEDWTKIQRDQILGTSLVTRYPHFSQAKYQKRLDPIFDGAPPAVFSARLYENVIPCRLPDGRKRIQQTTVTAVPVPEETRFMALFAIEDVTELTWRIRDYRNMRDQALGELHRRREAEKELILSSERLTLTLEGMDAVIYVADMETSRILYANPYTIRLFGQVEGKLCTEVMEPKDAEGRRDFCSSGHLSESENEEMASWEYFNPVTKRWYALCDRMITWINGRKAKLTIGLDIHDSKTAEKERLRREKLQGALEMAGAVCHELNQPLQSISGYAELLLIKCAENDAIKEKLGKIYSQTQKMGEITKRLMGITRYESKRYGGGEKIADIVRSTK